MSNKCIIYSGVKLFLLSVASAMQSLLLAKYYISQGLDQDTNCSYALRELLCATNSKLSKKEHKSMSAKKKIQSNIGPSIVVFHG